MPKKTFVSACTRDCPDCCSLLVDQHEDGKISLRGNPEHPFTKGFICPKTRKYPELLRHPQRITGPLVREGSGYWPVSWDEALGLIARRMDKVRATPERILHLRGHGYRGVFAEASNWFFATLGSSTLSGSPCDEAGIAASVEDFGELDTNHPECLLSARRIVNWGRDFSRFSIHQGAIVREARNSGTRVLTLSPGGDGNADFSDRMIRVRPGMDRFLAAALCQALLERGVPAEVEASSANLTALQEVLKGHDRGALIDACGVSSSDFQELLHWYPEGDPTATVIGWGLQRYVQGGETVRWINAVAMLSGSIGHKQGGAYYNISSGRNFAKWAKNAIPPAPRRTLQTHNIGREILRADPPVDIIWVDGGNPVNQLPAGDVLSEAFGKCDLVVAVDAFFNDTVIRADLVLPCALMGEREEVLGSCLHDYVAYSAKVMDPPGEARSDWDILEALGARLADPVRLPHREHVLEQALAVPQLSVTPTQLRERGFALADWPEVSFEGLRFGHEDGKYHFVQQLTAAPCLADNGNSEFPLSLLTLISRTRLHSQAAPDEEPGPPTAFIASGSPALQGLDLNRPVFLVTARGRIEVFLEMDDSLHPGAVVVRRGGWMLHGRGLNPLVTPMETDLGGGTAYYSQKARLENI